jgi:uncharacterized membrane protein
MACAPHELKHVPLFGLLDDEELAVLASLVEMREFAPRQRIYKTGEPGGRGYITVSGRVRILTVDQDNQEVVVDEPGHGEFFGFASMLDGTPHQTEAVAVEATTCLEVARDAIATLIARKPAAGMDMLSVLGHQFHAAHQLVRMRASRNPNEVIETETTFGEGVADNVARFGGSWSFIIAVSIALVIYTIINVTLGSRAWDPYPFILLNLFLSMLAAIQAPIIMMSQNRQDTKDRLRGELDYDVNRRAAADIQGLAGKVNRLSEDLGDVGDLLRRVLASSGKPGVASDR